MILIIIVHYSFFFCISYFMTLDNKRKNVTPSFIILKKNPINWKKNDNKNNKVDQIAPINGELCFYCLYLYFVILFY